MSPKVRKLQGGTRVQEQWKPVINYESSYEVSNYGRVKSLDKMVNSRFGQRNKYGKILKQTLSCGRYLTVVFSDKGKRKTHFTHQLVAKHFLKHESHHQCVNHKDGIKINNHISNLEYCTFKENINHSHKMGLSKMLGENHHSNKLKESQVIKIISSSDSFKDLAIEYNVSTACIWLIKNNRNWKQLKRG